MAIIRGLTLSAALAITCATGAEDVTSARKELAPTGRLKVDILVGSLGPSTFYAVKDPETGRLRGVTVDLGAALAKRLGVPLQLVPYASAEALNQSATKGAWNITFMTVDHRRESSLTSVRRMRSLRRPIWYHPHLRSEASRMWIKQAPGSPQSKEADWHSD